MDDCGVCEGINQWAKQAQSAAFASKTSQPVAVPRMFSSLDILECPPDYIKLGNATWTFLHTMAAYFPASPSKEDQRDIAEFFRILGKFYPCVTCAKDFQVDLKASPVVATSNVELSRWLCRMHNKVNEKLGKPTFDCSRIFERWKFGKSNCKE